MRDAALVTSPTAGRVLRVIRDSAGPVAAGAPLLELGDPRTLEVTVDVLSSDAISIAPGKTSLTRSSFSAILKRCAHRPRLTLPSRKPRSLASWSATRGNSRGSSM